MQTYNSGDVFGYLTPRLKKRTGSDRPYGFADFFGSWRGACPLFQHLAIVFAISAAAAPKATLAQTGPNGGPSASPPAKFELRVGDRVVLSSVARSSGTPRSALWILGNGADGSFPRPRCRLPQPRLERRHCLGRRLGDVRLARRRFSRSAQKCRQHEADGHLRRFRHQRIVCRPGGLAPFSRRFEYAARFAGQNGRSNRIVLADARRRFGSAAARSDRAKPSARALYRCDEKGCRQPRLSVCRSLHFATVVPDSRYRKWCHGELTTNCICRLRLSSQRDRQNRQ